MHNYCASVTVNKIGFKIDYTHKLININTEIKLRRTVGTETERTSPPHKLLIISSNSPSG